MPKFVIGSAVHMDLVPPPTSRIFRGQFEPVFEQIGDLKRGTALPIVFTTTKDALAGRSALRKIAKKSGETLSSSRSTDGLTFWFWLEPRVLPEAVPVQRSKRAA